jgi:hypothetical protein
VAGVKIDGDKPGASASNVSDPEFAEGGRARRNDACWRQQLVKDKT